MTGPAVSGNQAHDEDTKWYFDVHLGHQKRRVFLEDPKLSEESANPYRIHWPALLSIEMCQIHKDIYKEARLNPDVPHKFLRNYSLTEFVAIFKEAAAVRGMGNRNRYIDAPVVVSFGF